MAIRIPLILNSEIHLDSDLAVDGLTLLEAVQGKWRWHYPGTPYMGIAPVFLSWVQARIWGVGPITLVSGGTVAYILVLLATYALTWRLFGPEAAAWSLLPLSFSSTGTLWLSGRITGGHLLVVAWSAAAWLLLYEVIACWRRRRLAVLGVWCGLGLSLDSMFAITLAAMIPAGLLAALRPSTQAIEYEAGEAARLGKRRLSPTFASSLVFIAAFLVGATPRYLGNRVDPHDAYREQFSVSLEGSLLAEHSRILFLDCLPRLIIGHRLPGLEADPDPALLGSSAPIQRSGASGDWGYWVGFLLAALVLPLCFGALIAFVKLACASLARGPQAISVGLLASGAGVMGAFLVSRNIFNSDNYRYLALLLIPSAIGIGLVLRRIARVPGQGLTLALACSIVFAVLFTTDTVAWYRRLGWINEQGRPVRRGLDDAALRWLNNNPEIPSIHGSYWDVYRLSFLTGGRVRGVPFPVFPNRFPEWSALDPGGRPETVVVRSSPDGQFFLNTALREGGRVLYRTKALTILSWPLPRAIAPAS
jgi:hypothetical protein